MVFKIEASLNFQSTDFSYFFNLTHLVVCEKKSKIDFQNGSCGRFPINTDMILAQFDPEVVLSLQYKFRLKSIKGLGRDVEN